LTTSARTEGSASSVAHASCSASYISNVIELRAPGRLKVTSAVGPSRSTRKCSVIRAVEAPPRSPSPGGPDRAARAAARRPAPRPLFGELLEPLALLPAAPIEEHPDLLGARELLREEVVQVGLRARHDEKMAELGDFALGMLAPRAHVELGEHLLRLRPAPR